MANLWWPLDTVNITGVWGNSPEYYARYGQRGHNGIDLACSVGTPVYAAESGTVEFEGWGQNSPWMGAVAGISVILRHADCKTGYAHLSSTIINTGQAISQGQLIGYSGNTGGTTGPHLHVEVMPLNPNGSNGYAGRINPDTMGGFKPRGSTGGNGAGGALAPNQRKTGANPVKRRADATTKSAEIQPMLAANTVGDFDGWKHGERVNDGIKDTDIWFRGDFSKNWFWAGGFTSQSTEGLADLNPATPAPEPAPTPKPEPTPEPEPKPEPVPEPDVRKPVSATTPDWDKAAPPGSVVFPRHPLTGKDLKLPDTITQRVGFVDANGYNVGREGTVNHIVLHHGDTPSLEGILNTLNGVVGSPTTQYAVKDNVAVAMVDEQDTAWTNTRWMSNSRSVTVEICNDVVKGDKPSDASHETAAWLTARAAVRHGIELPLVHGINVFGHKEVSKLPTACPGLLDIKKIVARANEILATNPGEVVEPTPDNSGIIERLARIEYLVKQTDALLNRVFKNE